jgi:hypothetical protein
MIWILAWQAFIGRDIQTVARLAQLANARYIAFVA